MVRSAHPPADGYKQVLQIRNSAEDLRVFETILRILEQSFEGKNSLKTECRKEKPRISRTCKDKSTYYNTKLDRIGIRFPIVFSANIFHTLNCTPKKHRTHTIFSS